MLDLLWETKQKIFQTPKQPYSLVEEYLRDALMKAYILGRTSTATQQTQNKEEIQQ